MASEKTGNRYSSQQIFGDYLLMLLFPAAVSVWYYGMDAVRTIAVSLVTCFVFDFIASIVVYKEYFANDFSAICTGLMIAMMMPANIPFYVPVFACTFAIAVMKIPFGGGMSVPFVPAAAGFAFTAVCFKDIIFNYTTGRDYMTSVSIGSTLLSGGSMRLNATNVLDILTGNIYGPMGTGCIIVFIGCIIFLLIRRRSALLSTAGFLGACIICSLFIQRANGKPLASVVLELCSGSLMFAAVFLITDYSTLPKHSPNKVVYGAFCGFICMAMRYLGAFEEPICFAVLLANAFSALLDVVTDRAISLFTSGKHGKEAA